MDEKIMELLECNYIVDKIGVLVTRKSIDSFEKQEKVYIDYCSMCNDDKVLMPDCCFSCPNCGEVGGYRTQEDFIPDIWMKCQKVSINVMSGLRKKIREYVNQKYFNIMVKDFQKVLDGMKNNKLIKGQNLSRYSYYIIWIASRNSIGLLKNHLI